MRRWLFYPVFLAAASLSVAAQPASDQALALQLPIDCTLGENCWVARYSDRKKGRGKADFMCGRRTQHKHRGTDFSITDFGQMQRGVAVLAAANGKVTRLRDNMRDGIVTKATRAAIKGKECGNAVVLEHSGGYSTSYCHMKKGSIAVRVGDTVMAGQKLGEVGLSGNTEYPHMHFNLLKNGRRLDPFDGQPQSRACTVGAGESLWAKPPPYTEMDLLPLVFSDKPLTRQTRWEVQPKRLSSRAPALVLTGRAWNVLKGDHWLFHIIRPDGVEATERSLTIKESRQSQWFANRLFRPKGGFMAGLWKGKLLVLRQHSDGTVTRFESETSVEIMDE